MVKNKKSVPNSKLRPSGKVAKNISKKQAKPSSRNRWLIASAIAVVVAALAFLLFMHTYKQNSSLSSYRAEPYNIIKEIVSPKVKPSANPKVLISPSAIRSAYNLSSNTSGSGTVAIIDAYDDPNIESDLSTFDSLYNLPACTIANGCFTKHPMAARLATDQTWAVEEALDVEWVHAIAPGAKILLVEAASNSGNDLLNAINYTRSLKQIVAVSMSWGGSEFASETKYESDFTSLSGAIFFAASGDNGHGTSWPAVSANVIGVGGTTVSLATDGSFVSETAWSGSGGGLSAYVKEPQWQKNANVPQAFGKRASPDVAYNANPASGYPVYDSVPYNGYAGWFQVGGTSAGTPQWAAIEALSGKTLTSSRLYTDASKPSQTTFRNITSGSNGTCGYYCTARTGYNYLTGLGSPLTTTF